MTVRMRNASGDNSHRMYSFWGTPEKCRYIRTLNTRDSWNPTFGTIMVIESSKWCNEGDMVSLVVHDRDGFPFTGCCKMHRERSHQTQAFVFRDPYDETRVYRMGVSLITQRLFLTYCSSAMVLFSSQCWGSTWKCYSIPFAQSTAEIMESVIDLTKISSILSRKPSASCSPDYIAI